MKRKAISLILTAIFLTGCETTLYTAGQIMYDMEVRATCTENYWSLPNVDCVP